MKKIISAFLLAAFISLNVPAVFAQEPPQAYVHKSDNKEIIESRSRLKLIFAQDFDLNESQNGQDIVFKLTETITDSDNTVLPAGTKFYGKIRNKENSKWGFRKAKANINFYKLILPNGKEYSISSYPEKGELSSPTALNIAKGIGTSFIAAGVCVFGAAFIAIEALSIGGLIFAPITGAAVGVAVSVTSKGLNYKVSAGTPLVIVLDRPIEIDMYNYEKTPPAYKFNESDY